MLGWMKRYMSIGAAWLGATALSVLIASAAVAGIRDRVVEAPVAIGIPTTTTTLPADAGPTTLAPVTTTIVEASPTTAGVATTTEATLPPESATTTTTTKAPPTTTEPPAAATTTTAPPTTTTTAVSYVTYDLEGGTVVLAVGDGEVSLISATPRSGFRVDLEHSGPTKVEVKFESNDHTSKLTSKWDDGELQVKIKEEGSDDDDDDSSED